MHEQIGEVKLILDYYKGQDLYCDGQDIEEELLEIVKNNPEEAYNKIIFERKKWPILYHLSDVRGNIVNCIDFKSNESVLEIGAGCGAITSTLTDRVGKVTAIDLSKQRCLINAYKNKSKSNLEIIVGNFEDIELEERYDYITLIGVFEYAALYISTQNPYKDFLEKIKKYLKPNGKIIIAIENKYGMKYWAGCMEDHLSQYFVGLEGYKNTKSIRTFSKQELSEILNVSNLKNYKFYYPYPDYKFCNIIYSEDRLPQVGELDGKYPNFDLPRISLFNETYVLNEVIKDGLFEIYSNSYLIIISKDEE